MLLRLSLALIFCASVVTCQRCTLTTNDVEGPFYESGAPPTDIVISESDMRNNRTMVIRGKVMDRRCEPVSNAKVSIWYAGDLGQEAKYTFPGDRLWPLYRGYVLTDSEGNYKFIASYPGVYTQRPIPHVHTKVFTQIKEFTTQLYFKDDVPPGFEEMVENRQSQFPSKMFLRPDGTMVVIFNIVLDE